MRADQDNLLDSILLSELEGNSVESLGKLRPTAISAFRRSHDCEVTLEIAPSMEIVGIITNASATLLDLTEGKTAFAVIKASDVVFRVDVGADLGVNGG